MKGTAPNLRVGTYPVDDTSWFDVRVCDGGTVLSLCDQHLNLRYSVVIDGKNVTYREVANIKPEEEASDPNK